MDTRIILAAAAVSLLLPSAAVAAELAEPVAIKAAGQPLDMEHGGHAAPLVVDFDRDGKKDLLVGEIYDGRLRVYRNFGSNAEPKFEGYQWFKAGADLGRVPSG